MSVAEYSLIIFILCSSGKTKEQQRPQSSEKPPGVFPPGGGEAHSSSQIASYQKALGCDISSGSRHCEQTGPLCRHLDTHHLLAEAWRALPHLLSHETHVLHPLMNACQVPKPPSPRD